MQMPFFDLTLFLHSKTSKYFPQILSQFLVQCPPLSTSWKREQNE